jgi:thiol-disulfide isomerase/thioredoxin
MNINGRLFISRNSPQDLFLEVSGATQVYIETLEDKVQYPLSYDSALKLWTGKLVFDTLGDKTLEEFAYNSRESTSRLINPVTVFEQSTIIDKDSRLPIDNVKISIYEKNPLNKQFHLWDSANYGISNPFNVSFGSYSLILPPGEFYLFTDKDGYLSSYSYVSILNRHSFVVSQIELQKSQINIFANLAYYLNQSSANFELIPQFVDVTPQKAVFLDISKLNIQVDGKIENIASKLEKEKPSVLMFFNTWNTLNQQQIENFSVVADLLNNQFNFVNLTTLDPLAKGEVYAIRGEYQIQLYQIASNVFDDYDVNSMPYFLIVDKDGKVIDNFTYLYSAIDLQKKIQTFIK